MATANVIIHERQQDYAVVQLLTNVELAVGDSFTLSGLGHGLNGTHTVYALPAYRFVGVDEEGDLLFDGSEPIPNQVLFYDAGDDLERSAAIPNGTLSFTPVCSWIDGDDIQDWLGIPTVSVDDATFLTQCANAANAVAFRKRQQSGYVDSYSTVPGGDVLLGTIQLGGAYFRLRGAIDQFASFSDMGTPAPTVGLTPAIRQLLGVDRPACA